MRHRAIISGVLGAGLGLLVVVSDWSQRPVPNSILGLVVGFLIVNAFAWWEFDSRFDELKLEGVQNGKETRK